MFLCQTTRDKRREPSTRWQWNTQRERERKMERQRDRETHSLELLPLVARHVTTPHLQPPTDSCPHPLWWSHDDWSMANRPIRGATCQDYIEYKPVDFPFHTDTPAPSPPLWDKMDVVPLCTRGSLIERLQCLIWFTKASLKQPLYIREALFDVLFSITCTKYKYITCRLIVACCNVHWPLITELSYPKTD